MMNSKLTWTCLTLLLSFSIFGQTFNGKVTDPANQPMPFVNVVLLSAQDSAFINGTVTDKEGVFSVKPNGHGTATFYLIKFSFIGYETKTAPANNNIGVVVLQEESTELNEVLITRSRLTYKMDADGMKTNIANTLLSRLGTANDVLSQLPFVSGEDGRFKIFGRGEPIVYVNNKLVRDKSELRQIKSTEIKDVKVILNPGAQYDASVNAVIRITTLKPVGEGISGSLYTSVSQRRKFSHYENIKLNYRKGGLDVFGGGSFEENAGSQYQIDDIFLSDNADNHFVKQNITIGWESSEYSAHAGFNYSFNPKHTIGARYDFNRTPSGKNVVKGTTNHFLNDVNDYNFQLNTQMGQPSHKHYVNAYYHGELNENTEVHFDGDYVKGGGNGYQTTVNADMLTGEKTEVQSNSANNYHLYAGKAWISAKLLAGKITLGSEMSYTENNQQYKMLNDEVAKDLPSNYNSSDQSLLATFLTYDKAWNKLSFQAGLRYEYINFNYFYMGKRSNEQSRVYKNVFPSATIAYSGESVNMSLSYNTTTHRPSYNQLRSSVSYYDPYTYEGGNPALRPMFTNKLTYLLRWKDFQIQLSYRWNKDNIIFTIEQFKDRAVMLFNTINLPHSREFQAGLTYSPKIGWWRPTFEMGLTKQEITYKDVAYNTPIFSYRWNNIITLPSDYLLYVNMWGNTRGHNDVIYNDTNFRADIMVNKKFLNQQLNVSLAYRDMSGLSRQKWGAGVGAVHFFKWNGNDAQGVYLQATYTFNSSRSKYKGKSAASEELNRL